MIRTKDLEEFTGEVIGTVIKLKDVLGIKAETNKFYEEYKEEIIKRLRAYDKTKKEITEEWIDRLIWTIETEATRKEKIKRAKQMLKEVAMEIMGK